jgi:polyisoprenoid-binding protein YceI
MTFAVRALRTLTIAVALLSPLVARAADTYMADAVHSSVVFRVKHMNTSHAWGRFNDISGSFSIDPADATQSKMAFTIKAASVDTNNPARDNHLKGPDFFNAVQYPTISFTSESVAKTAKGMEVKGSLTFHGVTKPISFYVVPTGTGKDMKGNPIAGIDANFVIKQSDFGITKMAAAIGDEVNVFVSIEGVKK